LHQILRVATFNNFNYTEPEFKQLDSISDSYPEYDVFVNSNSYVKIKGKYPSVVSINPVLTEFVEPKGDISLIKAVRIKYVADAKPEVLKVFNKCVKWAYKYDIPILITYMRFRTKKNLKRYTKGNPGYYSWQKNYFRQTVRKTFDLDLFHYCDILEKGCPSCMNCSKLTYGYKNAELYSINLSSSGFCPFNCPDCYAKILIRWRKNIRFDEILRNAKQLGHEAYQVGYGENQLSFEDWMIKEAGRNPIERGF